MRQLLLTLTRVSKKTFLPKKASMRPRALVPTALSALPPLPIRMPFWLSAAQ